VKFQIATSVTKIGDAFHMAFHKTWMSELGTEMAKQNKSTVARAHRASHDIKDIRATHISR
jgi:hypothetical protein